MTPLLSLDGHQLAQDLLSNSSTKWLCAGDSIHCRSHEIEIIDCSSHPAQQSKSRRCPIIDEIKYRTRNRYNIRRSTNEILFMATVRLLDR
ncbi:hypothetical protein CDAR_246881 [Caerostris darwini]|uniref:Uncharacterized protein n=1 Tax=Caerostris darwini TaxID=1538125 RepID=A0AAV4UEW0_9ARAC|nr:hypothetical protein CDAR_246881 [Caerostris darwini]